MNIFENFAAAISTGATTLLVLTFGEVIPKCIGKEKSETIALYTSFVLRGMMVVLTPFSAIFLSLKSIALKLLNIKNDSPTVTEDELTSLNPQKTRVCLKKKKAKWCSQPLNLTKSPPLKS